MRRPTAAGPRCTSARRAAAHVSIRTVSLELLRASSKTMPEPVRPAAGMTNREIGRGARRRRLPFGPWQRCPNQRPMHGTLFCVCVCVRVAFLGVAVDFRSGVGRRFRMRWRNRFLAGCRKWYSNGFLRLVSLSRRRFSFVDHGIFSGGIVRHFFRPACENL